MLSACRDHDDADVCRETAANGWRDDISGSTQQAQLPSASDRPSIALERRFEPELDGSTSDRDGWEADLRLTVDLRQLRAAKPDVQANFAFTQKLTLTFGVRRQRKCASHLRRSVRT